MEAINLSTNQKYKVLRTRKELIEFAKEKKKKDGKLNKLGEWFAAGCPGDLAFTDEQQES